MVFIDSVQACQSDFIHTQLARKIFNADRLSHRNPDSISCTGRQSCKKEFSTIASSDGHIIGNC